MLNELTVQSFMEILAEVQGELCGACMIACILGTLLYWCLFDIAKSMYKKVFVFKKGRVDNEEKP